MRGAPRRPSAPGPALGPAPRLRGPRTADAASIWALVRAVPGLDLNSAYAYLLLCSDFASTSLVAEAGGRIVGFVGAYRPPPRPGTLFVWQIVVAEEVRGARLGHHLLDGVLARPACRDVRFLEATVTPSNRASMALFQGFARLHRAALREEPAFAAALFPERDHEDEIRVLIGPLAAGSPP